MVDVKLDAATFARLQAHAVPLIDTIDSVVNRALDALEAAGGGQGDGRGGREDGGARTFDPAAPPSLSFTTVKTVVVAGRRHPPAETYWNSVMEAVIREAAKLGKSPAEIAAMLIVNNVVGVKDGGGYKYIAEAGLSVQGQDANAAWRAAFHVADLVKIPVEVAFVWQDVPKAAFPGQAGRMIIGREPAV